MIASSRVLVTGANGFVGRMIVDRLARNGFDTIAVTRTEGSWHPAVARRRWASLDQIQWKEEFRGVDVVVHCAARTHVLGREAAAADEPFRQVNVALTLAMARGAAAAGMRRFIYISSAHVHGGRTGDRPFRADDPPRPENAYARSKWEAEQGLDAIARDTGLEVVVIRPPLVIGPHPKGNLGGLVAAMRRGLPLPLGAVTRNRRDLVSLDTLADLVSHSIDHPAAPGAPLLVSDGHPSSTRDVIERLAALHGLTPRLLRVPTALLRAALTLAGRGRLASQLLGNLEIDIAETCRRLDWRPPQGARL